MDINDIIGMIPALVLLIGVPVFIVIRRRRLARMTPLQRAAHIAQEQQWIDEEIEETSNPFSLRYAGIRHDDD